VRVIQEAEVKEADAKAQQENSVHTRQIEELEREVEKAQVVALAVASNTTDIWLNH
jgi:hypothetical protein